MSTSRSLPVLLPKADDQRWSCHSCGDCCRTLVGHLFDDERRRLDEQQWTQKLGVPAYVRVGRGAVLNKRPDGACVFLDDENHCRIHAAFGEAAKPLACRVFPFSLRPVHGAWQASLRFDCPSVIASDGVPLSHHKPWLRELARRLDGEIGDADERVRLQGRLQAEPEEIEAVSGRYLRWLRDDALALGTRLIGAARITGMLESARLGAVRGSRFTELLDLLFAALPSECHTAPTLPTARQSGLLRQLVFAHTEHVTLAELTTWFPSRWARRLRQLRSARRFHRGRGRVPPIGGVPGGLTFSDIETVEPAVDDAEAIERLVHRYLSARLEGKCAFGAGYYGWPLFPGLASLWLSIAVTGWLARYAAMGAGRRRLALADAGWALGVVDRAVSRLPALGAVAERLRAVYLLRDDGVARLLARYSLTSDQ